MLRQKLEIDLKLARRHLDLLCGGEDQPVAWQVFPDHDKKRKIARSYNGPLSTVLSDLKRAQLEGCGVFVAVNETDGKGRKEQNVTQCRALFLDLDGAPLPDSWPVEPHLLLQTSASGSVAKYQCWWFIEPTTEFGRWRAFQELLVDRFGGDPKCTLLTQVGRVAGSWHQKDADNPFQVRIMADNWDADFGTRHSLGWLAKEFGFDLTAADEESVAAAQMPFAEPVHGWDDPRDLARAETFLGRRSNWRETSNGEVSVFAIAAQLRDLGISPEKAEEMILEHLPIQIPADWSDDHVARKVANAYKYAKADAGTRSSEAIANGFPDDVDLGSGSPQRSGFFFTPYTSRDPKTVPPRAWLYKPGYIRQFTTGTLSHGGVGKSTLLTAEALAMASGKPLLGTTPIDRLRVAIWNGEDPVDELVRKVEAARKYYALKPEDVDGRLFLDSGRELPIQIAIQDRSGTRIARPVVKALTEALVAAEIDVLIIDPFVSTHAVSENDNTAIEQVARVWNEVAETANCAIHLAHHSVKARGRDAQGMDFRGGGAALAKLRHLRVLNPMLPKAAKKLNLSKAQAGLLFRADHGKANLAPPSDDDEWFKLESVSLGNADYGRDGLMAEPDRVGVVTQWTLPAAGLDPKLDQIDEALKAIGNRIWRKTSQSKEDWVGAPIAKVLGVSINDDADRKHLRDLIASWLTQGILVEATPSESDANGNKRPGFAAGKLPEEVE